MKKIHRILIISIIFVLCIGTVSIYGYSTYHNISSEKDSSYASEHRLLSDDSDVSDGISYNPVTSITLNKGALDITVGKKNILQATVEYDNIDKDNEPIVWSSKNTKVATVNQNGLIKAVGVGKTYIICSGLNGQVIAKCKVRVRKQYNPVKKISLDKTKIHLNKGDKRTLTPIIKYGRKTLYSSEPIKWKSSNKKVAAVNRYGVVSGKSKGHAYITVKSKYTGKTARCKVIVQKTKYIAFTFDDGPGIYTDKLLKSLKKYHCQATFFLVGNRVNSYKSVVKKEYQLGMEIGNHSYSHKNLSSLSRTQVAGEISKTNKAVKNIIGVTPTLLRPPYGSYNSTVSSESGLPMIYWTVDTQDWKYRNTNYVCNTILKNAGDSQIVLLHDIHKTSVNGFIKALPKLRKKGYELVTISELYDIKGISLKDGVMYYGPNNDK